MKKLVFALNIGIATLMLSSCKHEVLSSGDGKWESFDSRHHGKSKSYYFFDKDGTGWCSNYGYSFTFNWNKTNPFVLINNTRGYELKYEILLDGNNTQEWRRIDTIENRIDTFYLKLFKTNKDANE